MLGLAFYSDVENICIIAWCQ